MACMAEWHKTLTGGVGKCSVPMWWGWGGEAGFCDAPAFGPQEKGQQRHGQYGPGWRGDRWFQGGVWTPGYCAGLACYAHGGPKEMVTA